jgi:hypothetical protein
MDLSFWDNGCIALPFLNFAHILRKVKSSIAHGDFISFHFIF